MVQAEAERQELGACGAELLTILLRTGTTQSRGAEAAVSLKAVNLLTGAIKRHPPEPRTTASALHTLRL